MFYLWPFMMPSLFSFLSPTTIWTVSAPGWDYTPITEWGEGDLIAEKQIRQRIATPGREIGIMGDALVALVRYLEHTDQPLKEADRVAIGRLITLMDEIKPIMAEAKQGKSLREIKPAAVHLPIHPVNDRKTG
jgi:hypothetical protein